MIFLEKLKSFKNCPVCCSQLFPTIELVTSSDNLYTFTLKDYEYPLTFGRLVPFGGEQNEVVICADDTVSLANNIIKLMCKIICSCGRYKVEFSEHKFLVDTPKDKIPIVYTEPAESIYADKFIIRNLPPLTAVYLKSERSRWYKKLFTVPYKSLDYWHVDDKNKFNEKLNKLLLLYDRK